MWAPLFFPILIWGKNKVGKRVRARRLRVEASLLDKVLHEGLRTCDWGKRLEEVWEQRPYGSSGNGRPVWLERMRKWVRQVRQQCESQTQ